MMVENRLFSPMAMQWEVPWELEKLSEFKEDWDIQRVRMKPGRVEVDLSFYNTPRLQFSSVNYSNAILIQGSPPPGTIVLSMVESNDFISYANQKLFQYELIVVSHGEEMDYLARSASRIFTLAVEESLFTQSFFDYFDKEFTAVRKRQRFIVDPNGLKIFIAYMNQWFFCFSGEKLPLSDERYKVIEAEILETLFSIVETEQKRISKERFDIDKIRKVLDGNIDNFYKIGELTAEMNISPRTLQHYFKTRIGITPKAYLSQLRLHAIRNELLGLSKEKVKLSDIAIKYGFFNASHFAVAYKRVFGESPSQTLKRSPGRSL